MCVGACMRVCFSRSIPRLVHVPSQVVPVSKESKLFSPTSSYTACVHEVALDNTDVCIGGFTATPSRRTIVSFTSPVDVTTVIMIMFKEGEGTATGTNSDSTKCKEFGYPVKNEWQSDPGCCAVHANAGCADNYTMSKGDVCATGKWGTSHNTQCADPSESNIVDDDAVGGWMITCTFSSLPIPNTKHYSCTLSL